MQSILLILHKKSSKINTFIFTTIGIVIAFIGFTALTSTLISSFGTTSNSTAIASLSGAAETTAILYWLGSIFGLGVTAGTVITVGIGILGGYIAYRMRMGDLFKYAIDRSLHLLAHIVKILASFVVLCIVFILVGLVVEIITVMNSTLYCPNGFSLNTVFDLSVIIWIVFNGISLICALVCAFNAAEYFYKKIHLWEVRRFFRNRVNT